MNRDTATLDIPSPPAEQRGRHFMDKITEGLLLEFSNSFGISDLEEDERFERLATYLTVRKHFSETAFDPDDLITGAGGDTGIDAIAIIANNNLITDKDMIDDLVDVNGFLDVQFVFVQAERTAKFDAGKLTKFGGGVRDFFGKGALDRNEDIKDAAEIMDAVFKRSPKFTKGNPTCDMYYVTTGKWDGPKDLIAHANQTRSDLLATGYFSEVNFTPVGADGLQKLFNQSKNAITREFKFEQRTVIPDIGGVEQAHLGYLSATDILKLICDDDGNLIESLFYENVRGWHGYNTINSEMRATLRSDARDRFVLMNNGITILARSLLTTGHNFTMSDYQVVNGCQTGHVLHNNKDVLNAAVRIPVRIICTRDDAIMESIITATNRQTEVKQDQFFAMKDFAKKLEAYFRTFTPDNHLYYERRAHQYDSQGIEQQTRIVVHQNLVRAVGSMFLAEPHRATKNYSLLSAKVGKDIFLEGDKLEPYYVAAYTLYRLEYLFRNKKIAATYKPARYQILLAARLILDPAALPKMNSHDMAKRCQAMMEKLWQNGDQVLVDAVGVIDKVAKGKDRDDIRTQPVTDAILKEFGLQSN